MTKIKNIKTTIYKWTGEIVPPAQNFCTNPTDLLRETGDKMKSFRFHQWLVCEDISDEIAAAMLLKGLTVSYLINRTYKVKSGETVLFHAIAGGVGPVSYTHQTLQTNREV